MQDDDDMTIPDGKRCADCRNFDRCKALFGCSGANSRCDWAPHRFVELTMTERAAKNVAALAKLRADLDRAEWDKASPFGKSL